MKDKLIAFVKELKSAKEFHSQLEEATKQGVILPILQILGWNIFDTKEVHPEYALKSKGYSQKPPSVDYSLRIGKKNKVFIEAKRIREELESHHEQLLKYSFHAGVSLAILTNGISWWFYLPLMKDANWEERKFYTIDLIEQEPERIADKFIDLLSKDNVILGQAIKNAEATHESQQKKKIVAEALPKAWNKIISELEDPLVNFLMEITENLCGHRVGYTLAKQFLASNKGNLTLSEKPTISKKPIISGKPIKKDISIPVKKPPEDPKSSSRTAQMLAFLKKKQPGVNAEHIGLLIEIDKEHKHTFNVDWEHPGKELLVFGKSGKRNKPANALKDVFAISSLSMATLLAVKGNLLIPQNRQEKK
jgi:predicted type IV restriction endonuclease